MSTQRALEACNLIKFILGKHVLAIHFKIINTIPTSSTTKIKILNDNARENVTKELKSYLNNLFFNNHIFLSIFMVSFSKFSI